MIGYLSGIIKTVSPRGIIIDVSGIGYRVDMSAGDISRVHVGESAQIFCYTHVREDILQLFGFLTDHAREFFEVLIGVSGVGPKSALQILSAGTTDEVRAAIMRSDTTFLTRVPGVGKKIAERIILELRGKMPESEEEQDTPHKQAVDALAAMGYRKEDAARVLRDLSGSTEELVRQGLKKMHG